MSERARIAAQLRAKTRADASGCHIFTGYLRDNGYGQIGIRGKTRSAHAVAYELANGVVPDGLEIHHVCGVRACVNPAHLEAVTHRENLLLGNTSTAINAAKTHCHRGHEFTPENTRITARGHRQCRACDIIREQPRTAARSAMRRLRRLEAT